MVSGYHAETTIRPACWDAWTIDLVETGAAETPSPLQETSIEQDASRGRKPAFEYWLFNRWFVASRPTRYPDSTYKASVVYLIDVVRQRNSLLGTGISQQQLSITMIFLRNVIANCVWHITQARHIGWTTARLRILEPSLHLLSINHPPVLYTGPIIRRGIRTIYAGLRWEDTIRGL